MRNFKIIPVVCLILLTACQKQEYIRTSENGGFAVSDFEKIQTGMSYDEVVGIMGEPSGTVGYGIVWDVYALDDGSYIKMLFTGYDEILTKITYADGKDFGN